MRLDGVDPTSWSKAKERLLRHMFILDLIRDYNKVMTETMISWMTSPAECRSRETLDVLHDTMDKYKKSALYTIFTAEEKEKYQDNLVSTDEEIMAKVARM
jgi:hypothetical protein